MKLLALALLLCALLSLSNASCFFKHVEPGATHCQDNVDNTWHAVGSSWRNSDCMDCTCGGCCTAYSTPRQFPEDCTSVFNKKTCKYDVYKKNDPTVECPIFSGVGK